jgi:hypothetical protein
MAGFDPDAYLASAPKASFDPDAYLNKGEKQSNKKADPIGPAGKLLKGAIDPIEGGAQLLTNVLPDSWVKKGNELNNKLADMGLPVARIPQGGMNELVQQNEAEYQARRRASEPQPLSSLVTGQQQDPGFDWWRLGGNILSPANVALARIPAATSLRGRIGLGALSGAISSSLNPVTQPGDYWGQKQDQVTLGTVTGGVVPAAVAGVSRVIRPNAAANPNVATLRAEGVRPTVGQTLGGRWNALEEKLQSLPVIGDAIASQRGRALREFNQAAINRSTNPVGARVEGVGQGAVQQAGDAVSQVYDDALNAAGSFVQDRQFGQEVGRLRQMAQGMTPAMRQRFEAVYNNLIGARTSPAGGMTARTFKDVDSELGQLAGRFRGSSMASEQDLGDALTELQSSVRRQMVRSRPDVAGALAQADEGWANLVRVEGAAKAAKNNEGVFTPAQLNNAIQTADRSTRKRAVARGTALMQDLGNAGQAVLGNKVPNSGTAERLFMGGTTLLGTGAINPAIPAGILGGAALYTDPVQNALTFLLTQRPQAAQAVANALRQSTPALVPASAQVSTNLLR